MVRTSRLFLLFFLTASSFPIFAQQGQSEISLKEYLISCEKKFDINFTYVDEYLEGLFIQPANFDNVDELIDYLNLRTALEFRKVSEGYFAISKKETTYKICGFVFDMESNEPVVSAVIQWSDQYTVTDESGYFEAETSDQSGSIAIQSLGYKSLVKNYGEFLHQPCVKLLLKPNVLTLQEVVVKDLLVEGINKQVDGSYLIQTNDLGILPGLIEQDVLETVQALPGITSAREKVADVNVRAGTNDQNLVLWNGIRMYQYGHFFGLISAFNPYLTEDVKLFKNGTPASLSEGVSSTIEISSVDDIPSKTTGGIGLNFINGDFFLRVPVSRKIGVQLSARRSIADIITTPTYHNYYERAFNNTEVITNSPSKAIDPSGSKENFIFFDVNGRLIYDPTSKDKIRINFSRYDNELEFIEQAAINNSIISKTSSLRQHNTAVGASYVRKWSNIFSSFISGYYSRYDLHAVNQDINNNQRLIQQNQVIDNGLKAEIKFAVGDHLILNGGYHFTETGVTNMEDINNPTYYRYIKRVLRAQALFAEGEINSKNNRTNLKGGVRCNYFQKFDLFSLEPRLAFNHRFFSNFSFELLGEMKSQAVTQVVDLQSDFLGVENHRWVLMNNKDIPLLKSMQASAGINYDKGGFLFSMDGFYKVVDGITSKSQGFQNQFQYENAYGDYTSYGADFLVRQNWRNIKSWASYSISGNEYNFPTFVPSKFPSNFDIRHLFNLAVSYQLNAFEFSTGVKWHSGLPFTGLAIDGETGNIYFDSPNMERIPQYFRWDVSAKYAIDLGDERRIILGVSVWNLASHRNIVNQYYKINDEQQAVLIQQASLGVTPNASIRFHF